MPINDLVPALLYKLNENQLAIAPPWKICPFGLNSFMVLLKTGPESATH